MKIYIITSTSNLTILNQGLSKKFKSIEIQGTNKLLDGIVNVMNRHVIEEYDLMIILNQRFVEEDLTSLGEITKKINEACAYVLKDLPIYFLAKESNRELQKAIKQNIRKPNVKIYPYKNLTAEVVEDVIKEALVLNRRERTDMSNVHDDVLQAKLNKQQEQIETNIDRIFNERKKRDTEDFKTLNRIQGIISKYSTNVDTVKNITAGTDKSAKILSDLKNELFSDKSQSASTPKGNVPEPSRTSEPLALDFKLKTLNNDALSKTIEPARLKETLLSSDQKYNDYVNYMETLKNVIEEVKNSDEPNKHELILELLQEKAKVNNDVYNVYSDFMVEAMKSSIDVISEEYTKELDSLKEFSETKDVDKLIGGTLNSIEELKEKRVEMKDQVYKMASDFKVAVNTVNKYLSSTGSEYMKEVKLIEQEIKEYANENNLPIETVTMPETTPMIRKLETGYLGIKQASSQLMKSAQATMSKMMELMHTDEKIIDMQDEVIDVLSTQKTKKVITVDNLLQTKLSAIIGPDGVGKTHTAINMAYSHSKVHKTLLIDMNFTNPSLRYYNPHQDINTDNPEWFNKNTIMLEDFIRIPLGTHRMHELVPFADNITYIQTNGTTEPEEYRELIGMFPVHIKNVLDELAHFYDHIMIILPEDITEVIDVLDYVGVLYLINDFNPINFDKCTNLVKQLAPKRSRIPVKHFVANKIDRGIKISMKDYLTKCYIDSREYKYTQITEFKDSVQNKIDGTIPAETNVNVRRLFDQLIRK